MAGLPTNQRDQIMLGVAVVFILGAGAYWYLKYQPNTLKLDEKRAHIEKLEVSNQRAQAIMARGTVKQLEEESKRLKDNLDLMRTLIPAGNEVPALLDQILGAARRSGLEFSNFAPSATVQGESFDTFRFRISMQGSYHQLGELLASIGSLRRIIVPTNLSLAVSTTREARANRPDERILTASFDIQTYVVRTAGDDK